MSDTELKQKGQFSRRGLIAGSVAAGGIGTLGIAAAAMKGSEYNVKYPVVDQNKVKLPANGKSVVIIGGGLSGLQAGVELSSRGFKVTVVEKSGTPGGKLKTWRDKTFGPDGDPLRSSPDFEGYVREHGTHAIWGFYNNLREFMHRHGWGLQDLPEDMSIYHFVDKDGTQSDIPMTTWPEPFNRIQQLLNPPNLKHLKPENQRELIEAFSKLGTFDFTDEKQRAYMDSMTLEEYGKKLGLSDETIYKIFDSMVEMAYFDNVQNVSALTLANLMQLVAGSPEDLKVDLYMNPPGETFLEPMVKHIEAHGGQVLYSTEITQINMHQGKIKSVTAAMIEAQGARRCSICGALILGDHEFEHCPMCHANGDMIRPLSDLERSERTFEADYYLSAMDIPASQKFVAENLDTLGQQEDIRNILSLHATPVFVVDMWFEGHDFWRKSIELQKDENGMVFFATGFDHLGITLNWTHPMTFRRGHKLTLQKEFEGRDIAIVETQIAKAHNVAGLTDEEIVDKCLGELRAVMPDLPPCQAWFVNRWFHYTAYHPGDEGRRPPIQSSIENLLFIGDMPHVSHPAVFMEKTNVTAKVATNYLLDKIGQKEGKITILPSGTPSVLIDTLRKFKSVYA